MCCCCLGIPCCCAFRCGSNSDMGKTQCEKLFYAVLFTLGVVIAFFMRFYGEDMFVSFDTISIGCTTERCFGVQGVYRISFALALLFLCMAIATAIAPRIHSSYHGIKVVLLTLLMIASFFIPNAFFRGFAVVAQIASVFFLLLQLFIIIDFAFDVQDYLAFKIQGFEEKCSDEGREPPGICQDPWKITYLAIVAVLLIGSLSGIGAVWATLPACGLTNFFLSETLVLGIIFFVLSISITYPASSRAGSPGAIPPSLLFANNAWLAWGALTNNPDASCNPFLTDDGSVGVVIVSLVIVALSITWTTVRSATVATDEINAIGMAHTLRGAEEETQKQLQDEAISASGLEDRAAAGAASGRVAPPVRASSPLKGGGDDDEETGATPATLYAGDGPGPPLADAPTSEELAVANRYTAYFHVVMFLGSCYLAMLLSNWGTADDQSTATSTTPEASEASMWVRIATQFASWLLYLWILVAPILCPARFARDLEA